MEVRRNGGDVAKLREEERQRALITNQNAKIDYIAMMADVDFPDDQAESEVEG
jgi:hypothetical protein